MSQKRASLTYTILSGKNRNISVFRKTYDISNNYFFTKKTQFQFD